MRLFGDWKWYGALAVFALFTAFVICLPGPQAKSVTPVAPPAPVASQAELPAGRPEPTADERETMLQYTVQDDDTVAKIAHLFVVSEETLKWANRIPEDRDFTPGDKILIPSPPGPTPAEHEAMLRYTVQEGDTVFSIARLFVVPEAKIRWANQMPDGGDLSVGELIWIPVP